MYGYAATNASTGTINISGGKLSSSTTSVIANSTGVINISGGEIIGKESGIYNSNTGRIKVTGGTIIAEKYHGIDIVGAGTVMLTGGTVTGNLYGVNIRENGTLTMGVKDATVNTTSPIIQTTKNSNGFGVYINSEAGIFNFYDGKIITEVGSLINGTETDKPSGYEVRKTVEKEAKIASLKSTSNNNGKENVILYEQVTGNNTSAQMDEKWESNNDRSWILTGTMDGEITKRYKTWSNLYKSTVEGTADERGLEDNEYLTITIKDLNIDPSKYDEIRLNLDYLSVGYHGTVLIKTYSLEVYAIDNNNNRYGPFHLEDYETKGFYARKSSGNEIYDRNFNLVTEKIEVPNNVKITKLEILPYGNYPTLRDDGNSLIGNWRGQDSSYFSVSGIRIIGYKNSHYERPEYIKTKTINVNTIRENIVKRMYDLATIKWSPTVTFHNIHTIGADPTAIKSTYEAGSTYYGPPYTQRNRGTVERFASKIDSDGKLVEAENPQEMWGDDCSASVAYSVSKYIPLYTMYATTDFIWDRNKTKILGNLQVDGKESGSSSLKENYTAQEIYEAYAQLQKGDVISTHYKSNTHVRLISGNTYVVRKGDGTIDPDASYVIRTDIMVGQANTTHGSNDFGGRLNENDYVVPFEPKEEYTDINSLSELEGKNLNFYINKKTTFKELYNTNYVPVTFYEYLTGTVEEPYARLINGNTKDNIENGLKGTIYSNYTIIKISFNIHNNVTGEDKIFEDYINHRTINENNVNMSSLEGGWSNTYSLYYNTSEEIQNYIKEVAKEWKSFELKILVTAGENENMEVLNIKYDSVAPNVNIKYSNTELTKEDVIITIKANEEIQAIDGWTLSEDRKILTKTYTENKTEDIKVTDLEGNISIATIEITNIDKQTPTVQVKYSKSEQIQNGTIVTIEANERLQGIEGWQLSNDKKSLSRTYTQNIEETITICDLAGNSVDILIETAPELEVEFEEYNEINENGRKYIENIQPKTTLEAFVAGDKIKTNGAIEVIKNGEKITNSETKISTGMTLKISLNDVTIEYTIVVKGDVNGDGDSDISDIMQVNKHRLKKTQLTNEKFLAGDVNKNDIIDINDLMKINKYRLKKIDRL